MQSAHPSHPRRGSTGLRRASLVLAPCWALAAATLGAVIFRAWTQPLPNPATNGPIPDNGMALAVLWTIFMSVPLAGMTVPLAISGRGYLRSAALDRRWLKRWTWTVTAAVVLQVVFIDVYVASGLVPEPVGPRRHEWVMLVLSAGFMAAGAAMVAVITLAARQTRRYATAALPDSGIGPPAR